MMTQRLPQVIGSVKVYHHWHGSSQHYAGGDSLVTLIDEGWSIGEIVRVEEHWRSSIRRVMVYHFELTRGGDVQFLPVVRNPYVDRLLCVFNLRVIPMARRLEYRQRIVYPPLVKPAVASRPASVSA